VPILRAGRSLGVLVVQNKAHRKYREDEVEALETTSMVHRRDDRRRRAQADHPARASSST
jgi:hypothetical protein